MVGDNRGTRELVGLACPGFSANGAEGPSSSVLGFNILIGGNSGRTYEGIGIDNHKLCTSSKGTEHRISSFFACMASTPFSPFDVCEE